jgi:AcrR family transcriptional regulator
MRKNRKAEIRRPEILEHYYRVLIEEGFEGASIGKIAKRMDIHPSLIIHYFQTKENMTLELVKALIDRYEAPEYLQLDHISDPRERFQAFMDTLFSLEWSRTVDPGVHFGFYYLSFRNSAVRERFEEMIERFRDHLVDELGRFRKSGIVRAQNLRVAADLIVTLIEGLEFHAHFLSEERPFQEFAATAKKLAISILTEKCE